MHDALVLKTSPYSESTLIVWMLTRDEGVVRAIAKGARRIKGTTAAAFDLFSLVRAKIRLAKGDGLSGVSSVELAREWGFLRTDLRRLAFASLGMEILGAIAHASPPEPFFLGEAVAYLDALERAPAPGSLTAALLLRLLHHAGHPPHLAPELETGELPERLALRLDDAMILPRAEADGPETRWIPVSRALVERLRPALEMPPPLSDAFVVPAHEGAAILRVLHRIWEGHLNQPFRSMEFLEKMVLESRNP